MRDIYSGPAKPRLSGPGRYWPRTSLPPPLFGIFNTLSKRGGREIFNRENRSKPFTFFIRQRKLWRHAVFENWKESISQVSHSNTGRILHATIEK
jgi:hypothetical protein